MKRTISILAITFALSLSGPIARSQAAPATDKPATDATAAKPASEPPCARPNTELCPERTFYFNNVIQQIDANEIVTALRNTLPPTDKIFLVESENAILVRATPEDLALAQKLIADLDRPKKNYRLTFTVTEMDGSKQIGTEHYAMIMTSGQATTLKLGSKIPVATGSYSSGGSAAGVGVQTQFTYIDVGMNFDATLTEMGNNAMLKSAVEQSSVAPETSEVAGAHEPIIRQASLRGETFLTPGKPVALGSMDIPGSTSRLQIEVVMEPLP
jgi:type II secretory pathway component GspD/PulD (secretin)